jgi:hypothetical protein
MEWAERDMDMVWHHDPCKLIVAITIEVIQRVADHPSELWFPKHASTVASIEPLFSTAGKPFKVLSLRC